MRVIYDEAKAVQSEKKHKKRVRRFDVCFALVVAIAFLFIAYSCLGLDFYFFLSSSVRTRIIVVSMGGAAVCLGVLWVLLKRNLDTPPDVAYRELLQSHTVLEAKTLYDPEGDLLLCVTVEDDRHVVSKKYIPLPNGEIKSDSVSEPTVNLHDGGLYVPYENGTECEVLSA